MVDDRPKVTKERHQHPATKISLPKRKPISATVRLTGSDSPSHGRAEFFDFQTKEWGTICDSGPLTVDGWASVLCKDIGYYRAMKIEYAKVCNCCLQYFMIIYI